MFETRRMGKVVQHCKSILNPFPDLLRSVASHQTQIVTRISNLPQQQQLRSGAVKNLPFTKKWKTSALNEKVCFFFPHFNIFFVTHSHIPAIFSFLDLIISELSHSPSLKHSKTYLQSLETKTGTHFILWQS